VTVSTGDGAKITTSLMRSRYERMLVKCWDVSLPRGRRGSGWFSLVELVETPVRNRGWNAARRVKPKPGCKD
jgi:hypothetical protein